MSSERASKTLARSSVMLADVLDSSHVPTPTRCPRRKIRCAVRRERRSATWRGPRTGTCAGWSTAAITTTSRLPPRSAAVSRLRDTGPGAGPVSQDQTPTATFLRHRCVVLKFQDQTMTSLCGPKKNFRTRSQPAWQSW